MPYNEGPYGIINQEISTENTAYGPKHMAYEPPPPLIRKLEKAVAVRNSLLERFSGKFRRCWRMTPRFSGSGKCYPCQGLGTFRQGKRLLETWPRLRERCWIFSSETAAAFSSSSDFMPYEPFLLGVGVVFNLLIFEDSEVHRPPSSVRQSCVNLRFTQVF